MLAAKSLITTALLTLTVPAIAGTTLLDFENVSSATSLLSAINPYAALGISFTKNAWSVVSKKAMVDPGDGDFYRGLDVNGFTSNRGALILFDGKTDTGELTFIINVAGGFNTNFGFSYTTGNVVAGRVDIYSGENGSGQLVSGLALQATGACPGNESFLCTWNDPTMDMKGQTGKSIRITGQNSKFIFDNFKFQLNNTGTPIPEPGGLALSLAALGAVAWSRKRRKAG